VTAADGSTRADGGIEADRACVVVQRRPEHEKLDELPRRRRIDRRKRLAYSGVAEIVACNHELEMLDEESALELVLVDAFGRPVQRRTMMAVVGLMLCSIIALGRK
jgi:hypothetical protein